MKREFAAIAAALLILCGCSAKKVQDSSDADRISFLRRTKNRRLKTPDAFGNSFVHTGRPRAKAAPQEQ